MKRFAFILFFLLVFVVNHSRANDFSANSFNFNPVYITNEIPAFTNVFLLQGNFLDEQDTNDIDTSDGAIVQPNPPENPFPFEVKRVEIVLPLFLIKHISKLLLDLPPPLLSA